MKADGGWSRLPTGYAKKSHKEYYCECFSLWIGRKATFATLFPNISDYFDKLGVDVASASATKAGASPGTLKTPNPNDPLAGLGL